MLPLTISAVFALSYFCNIEQHLEHAVTAGYLRHNGECANDASGGGNGSKVILYTCTSAQNDRWTHKSNGEYVLAAHGGKLCLTDTGNSRSNGVQLTVATCKNTANQHWTLP